ncbi:MAG TPA: hypothetical protein VHU84_09220, partial [Lacipirellulaceae bacterium]|nr:hypothetical protein [Lacipirellulaceae bacterium]
QLAAAAVRGANLAILVEDASQPTAEFDQDIASLFGNVPILRVRNKIDLCVDNGTKTGKANDHTSGKVAPMSAFTGQGIAELIAAIGAILVPTPPPANAAVPFAPEQVEALVTARNAIEKRDANVAIESLQSLLAPANSEPRVRN